MQIVSLTLVEDAEVGGMIVVLRILSNSKSGSSE